MLKKFFLALVLSGLPAFALAFELGIDLDSADAALQSDLRGVTLTSGLADAQPTPPSQDILAAAQADYARIIGLMYDRGFFAPVVSILVDGREASSIPLLQSPRSVSRIDMRVQTGAPFRFGTAKVAPIAPGTIVPGGFASGQPAGTAVLRETANAGVTGWRNQGHAQAALSGQSITADHSVNEINVDISLTPGPRLTFGNLRIRGNQDVRSDRIRDIAGLPTGATFDPAELDRVATRLRRTGAFSVVSLTEAEDVGAGDTLDIEAQFVEAKPRRFGFGAEVSSNQGLALSGFWLHRNLLGGAENLRLSGAVTGIGGETGGEDYELALNFRRPATFNQDTNFFVNAELQDLDEPNFTSQRLQLEAGIRRFASEQREYTFAIGYEAADTTDVFGDQTYQILTFPATAEFDYRDNELDATEGFYLNASLTPFLNVTGTESGVRLFLDGRTYKSIGPSKRVTLALRGQIGSLSGPTLANAPADFLFFSGGGGTVRGQDFQSLGIDLGDEEISGGRSFIGLSGEVRVKTGEKLGLVAFYDAGYVGSEAFPDATSGDWHSGVGLGVRYDTGIGPVRADIGIPASGPGTQGGIEIYIGLGQAF